MFAWTSFPPSRCFLLLSYNLDEILFVFNIPVKRLTTSFCRDEYELLEAVQAKLVVHTLTAPVLGNDHKEFRGRENPVSDQKTSSNFSSHF